MIRRINRVRLALRLPNQFPYLTKGERRRLNIAWKIYVLTAIFIDPHQAMDVNWPISEEDAALMVAEADLQAIREEWS